MNNNGSSKNVLTLCIGAFIVLMAIIVFLTTSWNTFPSIVKIMFLFLFEVLFLGGSKLSKSILKLDIVSKTLLYIAMCYLPICFLLVSLLELMHPYFLIGGDGAELYFGFTTLITSLVYMYYSFKDNDKILKYASIIFQMLALIFFAGIFKKGFILAIDWLLIYILLLTRISKDYYIRKYSIVVIGLLVLGILSNFSSYSWLFVISWLLLTINLYNLDLIENNVVTTFSSNLTLYLFFYMLIFRKLTLVLDYSICQFILLVIVLVVYNIFNIIFKNNSNKYLSIANRTISLFFVGLLYIIFNVYSSDSRLATYFISGTLEIIIILNYIFTKNSIYKYSCLLLSNLVLVDIFNYHFNNIDVIYYIPLITTSTFVIFDLFNKNKNGKVLLIFLTVLEAISYFSLLNSINVISTICVTLFSILIIIYNKIKNNNKYFDILPLFLLLAFVSNGESDFIVRYILLLVLIISLVGLTFINKNNFIYVIFSLVYLLVFNTTSEFNKYFFLISFILWAIIHLFIYNDNKFKFIFKWIIIILFTSLYYVIMSDLLLLDSAFFKVFGVGIGGVLLINGFAKELNEYAKFDLKKLKYGLWFIIDMYALSNYMAPVDGILYTCFLIVLLIVSYYMVVPESFLISLIYILINAFYLTKEYWLLIPWWIFLFIIGGILILIAIVNEVNKNNNKDRITFKTLIEKYKNRFNIK